MHMDIFEFGILITTVVTLVFAFAAFYWLAKDYFERNKKD